LGPPVLAEASVAEPVEPRTVRQEAGGPVGGPIGGPFDDDEDDDDAVIRRRGRHLTALRLTPWRPRRDSDVVIQIRCPEAATHATVASSAFNAVGSRRGSREVGLGLDDDGYAHDTEGVVFDSRLGDRRVWLRCVKVEVNEDTLVRSVRLVSRLNAIVRVRRHIVPPLICRGVRHFCHNNIRPDEPAAPVGRQQRGQDLDFDPEGRFRSLREAVRFTRRTILFR
jgi:hypothetical protein